MQDYTGKGLAESLLEFLNAHNFAIADCRGQPYDYVSNLSGKYNDMLAVILRQCNLAKYVSCAARSLNMVGQSAVGYCSLAIGFF